MRGDFSVFRASLLDWFRKEKRDLPWRRDPSLYKTVVSEFMLQQTQVETVLPYFGNWLKRFPDFRALAQAEEATVRKHWEGLGYYTRARNLHRLAQSIIAEGIPQSVAEWMSRPGIGPYTAAAISSIAQGFPEPVVDGNVIRVLCRLENDAAPIRSLDEGRRRLLPLARKLIDAANPGDFNEAVMELGATVCRKARPLCDQCPVRAHCQAVEAGAADQLPVIVRKATRKHTLARLWLVRENRILLHFYPTGAKRLAGIAELPQIKPPKTHQPILTRSRGISCEQVRESIHRLPHDHAEAQRCIADPEMRWIPLEELGSVTLSAPHRRWIEALLRSLELSDKTT